MAINKERQLGRARNAVLSFLGGKLWVPKIYLDTTWDGRHVDVLAIDRDGVGDVHAVVLLGNEFQMTPPLSTDVLNSLDNALISAIDELRGLPAQYKYIAAVNLSDDLDPLPGLPHATIDRSYDEHGLGRVGFLSITGGIGLEEPTTKLVQKPERFRAFIAEMADEYVSHHSADWEIRP